MRKTAAIALAIPFLLASPAPARADRLESWNLVELRVPMPRLASWSPHQIRVVASSRFSDGYPGLGVSNMRLGPIWDLAPWLMVAAHGSAYAEQRAPGAFAQQMRLELEPNVRYTFGALHLNDRSRFEWRYEPARTSWRYRNQLRASYQPKDWNWWPTASAELNWEVGAWTVQQTRLTAGTSHALNDATRLTAEYLARWRPDPVAGVALDHILTLTLFFSPSLAQVEGQGFEAGD